MSAVILGSPGSAKKVLRRNEFSTQRNGLEFINEIYTIRTADRATLQPAFDTLHKNYSESATKYARMAVENVAFKEMDGDLTEMTVSYVGLTSASGLPPALSALSRKWIREFTAPHVLLVSNILATNQSPNLLDAYQAEVGLLLSQPTKPEYLFQPKSMARLCRAIQEIHLALATIRHK